MQDRKNCHLGTIAQLCRAISSQLRHVSTIGKKIVKQQYLLHMFPQYGELRPTSGWDRSGSLGHTADFDGFHVLAALLHGTLVVGVSQTLRRWIEGVTYIHQGGHPIGHWSTFLVDLVMRSILCLLCLCRLLDHDWYQLFYCESHFGRMRRVIEKEMKTQFAQRGQKIQPESQSVISLLGKIFESYISYLITFVCHKICYL